MADWQPSQLQLERQAYRRSRARRSAVIAFVSTVVVFSIIAVVAVNSPGWSRTRDSFFDLRTGWHDLPALLHVLWVNVQIMLIAEVIVLVFATILAVLRTLQGPVFFPLRLLA